MNRFLILVVEDDEKIARMIKRGLEEENYVVDLALDGLQGRAMALENEYHLILLDVNLPGINGFEVCAEIRKHNLQVPVIMLTAMGLMENKLTGFENGADDYIVKPFEFKELYARIRVFLKRSIEINNVKDNVLTFADVTLDMDAKKVFRSGKEIVLTAKEFYLLEYLMRNKNRVLSRNEIAEKVWDIDFDTGTNFVDVYITYLRKKMEKEFKQKLIHTVTGMGYVLREE